ncbi:NUDIX domain-containing protein [Anaerobacterium chartisolvens]|uniref:NUDIX domain-containing protein n=1 Tax=Anaerobacterium chartisolvens TaxID=1297424 RepID=A0A369BCI0_9FIRM|nr:NUDIX hydrolase [Anaerobacterium chartisolvens]RCX18308.1 NUDIX domain-containing protein [Anaerobacterium chartisolvens]
MLVRNCAGGVVFYGGKVLLLKNEKGEWILPKGIIRNGDLANEVALKRVREEAGVKAEIVSTAGRTDYEFFSVTRHRPVCNKVTWYIMKSSSEECELNKSANVTDGGFFSQEDALRRITYSQDRSLLSLCFDKMKELA